MKNRQDPEGMRQERDLFKDKNPTLCRKRKNVISDNNLKVGKMKRAI